MRDFNEDNRFTPGEQSSDMNEKREVFEEVNVKNDNLLIDEHEQYQNDFNNNDDNTFFLLRILRSWFSKQPLTAFSKILTVNQSLILFGIHILAGILQIYLGASSFSNSFSELNAGPIFPANFGTVLIVPIIIIGIIFYSLITLTIMIVAKIIGSEHSKFSDAMSAVSIALVPVTVLSLIGFILGFLSPGFSMLIGIVGFIINPFALYLSIEAHLGKSNMSPFWVFPIVVAIMLFVLFIIIFIALIIISAKFAFDFKNSFPKIPIDGIDL